jgi:hypothetical protein
MALVIAGCAGLQSRRLPPAEQAMILMKAGTTLPVTLTVQLTPPIGQTPGKDTGINILIDQAHQTSFAVLWGMAGEIRGRGYRSCTSLASLDSVLTPGKPSRIRLPVEGKEPFAWWPTADFNIVITTQNDPHAQPYTEKEIAALQRFVKAGGGLMIAGTRPHDEATARDWSMNRLTGAFGAGFIPAGESVDGRRCAALKLDETWTPLVKGSNGQPVRASRAYGKGRVMIWEDLGRFTPAKELPEEKRLAMRKESSDALTWLAANKPPVGGDWRMPGSGGAGIFPEKEIRLDDMVVYYAANQPPSTLKCIEESIPRATLLLNQWFPSRKSEEPYPLVICAGGGGGWAINTTPRMSAVIEYQPLAILGVFAHELLHTRGGPLNAKDELAASSPHGNQGEAHAGWFQGKISASFGDRKDLSNRNCNSILDHEKRLGMKIDLAKFDIKKYGHGTDWTKFWWIWQKLDDRYGPTWYTRWYWIRSTRWMDQPDRRESWDEMVEDMSIAVGEDLFPFFGSIGTTLTKARLERIEFQGKTIELPVAPIDNGPAGNVNLNPIGDYRLPITLKK